MSNSHRPWERWDDPGVARTIDGYWRSDANERAHRRAVASLLAGLCPPGTSLLEVGCGSGLIYEAFAQAAPGVSYVGVDTSLSMLEIARSRFPSASFDLGDAYAIAYPDDSFDVACAFEVLGHLPDVNAAIAEMCRVARRCVVVSVWPGEEHSTETIGTATFLRNEYKSDDIDRAATAVGWNVASTTRVSAHVEAFVLARGF